MLDDQDIKKIGDIVKEQITGSEGRVIEAVGEMVEQNITPALDKIHERLDTIEGQITTIKADMVTKSYLDDKLADHSGEVVLREKKLDQKVNLVVDALD